MDFAYEMVFAALIGGIIGAKLWYVVENGGAFFTGTGLVFYGGLIGGALAVIAWAKYRGELDLSCRRGRPVLAAAYAIGRDRLPALRRRRLRQELGRPVGDGVPERHRPDDATVHPTPIYERLAMGLFAYVLWRLRDRWQPGVLFGVYLIGVGVERFLVEFLRRNDPMALGLTQPQWVSVAFMSAAARGCVPARRGLSAGCSGLKSSSGIARGVRPGAARRRRCRVDPFVAVRALGVLSPQACRPPPRRSDRRPHRAQRSARRPLASPPSCPPRSPTSTPRRRASTPVACRSAAATRVELAREFGTPLYAVAEDDLRNRAREFRAAMGDGEVVFASKAFPCTAVLQVFERGGAERRRRVRR